MSEQYECPAIFRVTDPAVLIRYAMQDHQALYPLGTEHAALHPNDIASALGDALIDCKDGPAVEDLGRLSRIKLGTGT